MRILMKLFGITARLFAMDSVIKDKFAELIEERDICTANYNKLSQQIASAQQQQRAFFERIIALGAQIQLLNELYPDTRQ